MESGEMWVEDRGVRAISRRRARGVCGVFDNATNFDKREKHKCRRLPDTLIIVIVVMVGSHPRYYLKCGSKCCGSLLPKSHRTSILPSRGSTVSHGLYL